MTESVSRGKGKEQQREKGYLMSFYGLHTHVHTQAHLCTGATHTYKTHDHNTQRACWCFVCMWQHTTCMQCTQWYCRKFMNLAGFSNLASSQLAKTETS